jgi:cytochrome c553
MSANSRLQNVEHPTHSTPLRSAQGKLSNIEHRMVLPPTERKEGRHSCRPARRKPRAGKRRSATGVSPLPGVSGRRAWRPSAFDVRCSMFDVFPQPSDDTHSRTCSLRALLRVFVVCCLALYCGCRQGMYNQPKYKPLAESELFADGASARPLVPHTVARGYLNDDEHFYTGKINGVLVETFPFPITRDVLQRGRERFDIYCSVCHGRTGDGNGMIVQRGFPVPPSYHIDRLHQAPVGHFFNVMTNGYGVMYSYAARVDPPDRWAIAAYIRALQLSHNARPEDVPPGERTKLERE